MNIYELMQAVMPKTRFTVQGELLMSATDKALIERTASFRTNTYRATIYHVCQAMYVEIEQWSKKGRLTVNQYVVQC